MIVMNLYPSDLHKTVAYVDSCNKPALKMFNIPSEYVEHVDVFIYTPEEGTTLQVTYGSKHDGHTIVVNSQIQVERSRGMIPAETSERINALVAGMKAHNFNPYQHIDVEEYQAQEDEELPSEFFPIEYDEILEEE